MSNKAIQLGFYLFLIPFSLQAQQPAGVTPWSTNQTAQIVEAFLKEAGLPGISIAMRRDTALIYAKGFGYADLEAQKKVTTTTRLRAASVSKIITATALGRLATTGHLTLDARIGDYISGMNDDYGALTIRQLAGHTSGVVHRGKGAEARLRKGQTEIERARQCSSSLLFIPDREYKYSTHGFNLLAAVIEVVTQKRFSVYMQDEIFEPLGMTHTWPEDLNQLMESDATLYYFRKNRLKRERSAPSGEAKLAGAGFRTTPTDLVRMMDAYHNGFIAAEIVQEMFVGRLLDNGTATQVGLAWRSSIDIFDHQVLEHAGNWSGARSVLVYYPDEKLSISIMINATCPVFIEETAHLLAQIVRQQSPAVKVTPREEQVNVSISTSDGLTKQLNGSVSFSDDVGLFQVDGSQGFLHSNRYFSLGTEGDYGLVTRHGILYMSLNQRDSLRGEVHMYSSQNAENPREGKPVAEISTRLN